MILNETFSKVYYINLDARTKRKELLEQQFIELGIQAERLSATKGSPWGFVKGLNFGECGCISSHLRVIEEAKKQKLDSVLILEDDALFCRNFEFRFYEAYRLVPENWQMLYLGGNNNTPFNDKFSHRLNKYVYRALSTLTTSSYALKQEVYDLFIDRIKVLDKSLDLMYISIQPTINAYCLVPALATQRMGWSDIQMCDVDYKDMIK